MKEQEKGEGSDSKESPKTKSDESGEEKNGDEDCQRGGQKKKGERHGAELGSWSRAGGAGQLGQAAVEFQVPEKPSALGIWGSH